MNGYWPVLNIDHVFLRDICGACGNCAFPLLSARMQVLEVRRYWTKDFFAILGRIMLGSITAHTAGDVGARFRSVETALDGHVYWMAISFRHGHWAFETAHFSPSRQACLQDKPAYKTHLAIGGLFVNHIYWNQPCDVLCPSIDKIMSPNIYLFIICSIHFIFYSWHYLYNNVFLFIGNYANN